MIQGFGIQLNNISNTSNRSALENKKTSSKSGFQDLLNTQAEKSDKTLPKSKQEQNSQAVKASSLQASTRRAEVKGESSTNKGSKETPLVIEDKKLDELVEDLGKILAVLQNVIGLSLSDLENIDLEGLNLEISLEELEALSMSLKNLSGSVDLGDLGADVESTIVMLDHMVSEVKTNGELELLAEDFILKLKQTIDALSQELKQGTDSSESLIEESSKSLEDLVNLLDKAKDTKGSKEVKENKEPLEKNTSEIFTSEKTSRPVKEQVTSKPQLDDTIKIKIVSEKKEGLNLFNHLGQLEEIDITLAESLEPSVEPMPINILNSDLGQVKVESQTNISNTISPENYLIDKSDVIKQITSRVKTDYESQLNEIKIKLSPEHLGDLTIKVSLERGILSARALVENTNIKQLLETNIEDLKTSLKEQGIEFSSIDVSVGSDPDSEERQHNFFMNNKRVKNLKTTVENPVDMNYYEDLEANKSSQMLTGEGGMDITI